MITPRRDRITDRQTRRASLIDVAQERFFGETPMPDVAAQWRAYVRMLRVAPGARVLDVGCHEGDAIALLLSEHPDVSRVVGVDRNERKTARARERFAGDGRVEIVTADAMALPLDDDALDRTYCADMLEWVSDPVQGLCEMRRVLAPAGLALAIHTDFDTQVFASDDLQLTRKFVHAFNDSGRRGTIGRDLFGLCNAAGFAVVEPSVFPFVGTSFAHGLYPRKIVALMRKYLVEQGDIAAAEFDAWTNGLEQLDRERRFFYSVNRNLCLCTK